MNTRSEAPAVAPDSTSKRGRRSRRAYWVVAWIYLAAIIVQVFLAGMATFVSPMHWRLHSGFVPYFALIPLFLIGIGLVGRIRRGDGFYWRPFVLLLLTFVQMATANVSGFAGAPAGWIGAIHPVVALGIFFATLTLVRDSPALLRSQRVGH